MIKGLLEIGKVQCKKGVEFAKLHQKKRKWEITVVKNFDMHLGRILLEVCLSSASAVIIAIFKDPQIPVYFETLLLKKLAETIIFGIGKFITSVIPYSFQSFYQNGNTK